MSEAAARRGERVRPWHLFEVGLASMLKVDGVCVGKLALRVRTKCRALSHPIRWSSSLPIISRWAEWGQL